MEIQEPDPGNSSKVKLNQKIISFFLIFIISSCSKEHNPKINQNSFVAEKLAKYSDIPVPIGYEFVDTQNKLVLENSDRSDYLSFIGQKNLDQSLKFYLENMEVLGWEINDFSNKDEALLVCNKLNRSCVISIRGEEYKLPKTKICIFVLKNLKPEDNRIRGISSKKFT